MSKDYRPYNQAKLQEAERPNATMYEDSYLRSWKGAICP